MLSITQLEWMSGEAVRTYGDVIPAAIPNVRNITIKQGLGELDGTSCEERLG